MKTVTIKVQKLTAEVQQTIEAQGYEIVWSRIHTLNGATLKVRKV